MLEEPRRLWEEDADEEDRLAELDRAQLLLAKSLGRLASRLKD